MNIIKKMFSFIKHIFNKEEKVKALEAPKEIQLNDKKADFANSIRATDIDIRKNKNIETLVCIGDGLGIQPPISG